MILNIAGFVVYRDKYKKFMAAFGSMVKVCRHFIYVCRLKNTFDVNIKKITLNVCKTNY